MATALEKNDYEFGRERYVTCNEDSQGGENSMPRYGRGASKKVERAMHELKTGTLRSGRSGKRVTSKKQAIAIGLSEARQSGAKVPSNSASKKK